MKHLSFLLFLLLLASASEAQPLPRRLGLNFNDAEYNTSPRQSRFAGSKGKALPVSVSLKKYCPIPGDQGEIGSCVGWSSCYGVLTMMYAQKDNITDPKRITAMAHSGLFAYNLTKQGDAVCDGGTRIPLLLDVLKKSGSCYHKNFDVEDCSVIPAPTLQQEAAPFAIKDYEALFGTTDDPDLKIQKTKQSLAEGKPVEIGMALKYNFLDVDKADPVWHPEKGLTMDAGGHAMAVIGYDDGKGCFEVLNSWGEKWGDNGFGWIKYEDYGLYCKYAFQILINDAGKKPGGNTNTNPNNKEPNKEVAEPLKGDFIFQYLTKGSNLNFLPAKIAWNDNEGYYQTVKRDWKVGQLFQLIATSVMKDQYLYVFSVDAEKKVNQHFPRTVKNSEYGFNETPLITVTGAQVVIPSPESALSIGQAGTDWLVVFFSKTKIDDYEELIDHLQGTEGDELPKRLNRLLKGRMADPSLIKYNPDQMSFTFSGDNTAIVPMILRVNSER